MYTGTVGYDGVAEAFDTLLRPNDHVEIMVEPRRSGALEVVPHQELALEPDRFKDGGEQWSRSHSRTAI